MTTETTIDMYNKYYRNITCTDYTYRDPLDTSRIICLSPEDLTEKFNSDDIVFHEQLLEFLDNSKKLNYLEKLNNTSNNLNTLQKDKLSDLKISLDQSQNDEFNTIRKYQINDYKNNEILFINSVYFQLLLLFVIIFTLSSYANLGYLSSRIFFIISIIIGILFVLYIIINIKQNMYRRKYDWNKFYFTFNKPKKTL